jgi:hypothetical protein
VDHYRITVVYKPDTIDLPVPLAGYPAASGYAEACKNNLDGRNSDRNATAYEACIAGSCANACQGNCREREGFLKGDLATAVAAAATAARAKGVPEDVIARQTQEIFGGMAAAQEIHTAAKILDSPSGVVARSWVGEEQQQHEMMTVNSGTFTRVELPAVWVGRSYTTDESAPDAVYKLDDPGPPQ